MAENTKSLNVKWGITTFILSYIVLTILGFAAYYILAVLMHVSLSANFNIQTDKAYQLSQRIMVLINFATWFGFAWMYFQQTALQSMKHAWALGGFWLILALPIDYIGYVVAPTPDQLTAHEYYVGQFPWIYMVYVIVLIAPACYLLTKRRLSAK
jgi:hypothetical protein